MSGMANLATKAPNFTSESGSRAGIQSGISRKLLRQREKDLLAKTQELERLTQRPNDDETRKATTLRQIDGVDKLINNALDDADEERFLKLTAAKERLWKLVQPTAGVMRPGRNQARKAAPSASETPQQPSPATDQKPV